MNREEAIAAGMEVHEIQHSMKRRTPWHDYSRKGTYMLTLVVRERMPILGTLRGCLEGESMPYVELSALGNAIVQEEQQKINQSYPLVEVWKLCIMPDHLHMIVRIKEHMGENEHLGKVVAGFKSGCNNVYWRLFNMNQPPRQGLFEKGYCDKILMHEGQLDNWKHYLDDNPRRLMMKRQNPELFSVLTGMEVAGEQCQVVGNRFLLNIFSYFFAEINSTIREIFNINFRLTAFIFFSYIITKR